MLPASPRRRLHTAPTLSRRSLAHLALAGAAFLFGTTFVVVKEAVVLLPPLAFVAWRFLIGGGLLLAMRLPRGLRLWRDGSTAGLFLFAGYALQTEGLTRTSAANSGLITGLYVVFTPFLAAAMQRRTVRVRLVAGAALAFLGLALLTVGDGLSLRRGDLLTVGCALAFAVHIVLLARIAPRHAVVPLTAVQLLTTATAAALLAMAGGDLRIPPGDVWPAVLFTAVAVTAVAFLAQIWSQTVVGPSRTAIILALEPAFAAATAALVIGERLTGRGWLGAALILGGILGVVAVSDDELPAAEAVTAAH